MNLSVNGLLRNRFILYVVMFISLASVLNYLNAHNYKAVLIFLTAALLVNCFNKNMTFVLISALLLTHLLTPKYYFYGYGSLLEGMGCKGVDVQEKEKEKNEEEEEGKK